jgi:hypothetical protein
MERGCFLGPIKDQNGNEKIAEGHKIRSDILSISGLSKE